VIRPPHRSVTRFFIPLIDVLILLFCIFLLMPFVSAPAPEADAPPGPERPPADPAQLERDLRQAQAEVARLRQERAEQLQRLLVRVLEIDRATGELYYREPERVQVRTEADAQALINRERARAGGRDLYFLLLYPRDPIGYPTQEQVERYLRWFASVPHGLDDPRAGQ
jgi:hypothetical protein